MASRSRDVVLGVEIAARIDRMRRALDHLGRQRDVGRDHEVAGLQVLDDVVVRHVEALGHPDAS